MKHNWAFQGVKTGRASLIQIAIYKCDDCEREERIYLNATKALVEILTYDDCIVEPKESTVIQELDNDINNLSLELFENLVKRVDKLERYRIRKDDTLRKDEYGNWWTKK